MSVLNATGDNTLDQVLVRRLQTPGGSVAPGVAPEIFGNVTIENDRPEWEYLKGGGLYMRGLTVGGGGAGTRSSVSLINPAQSSTLVVVEFLDWAMASTFCRIETAFAGGVFPFGSQTRGVTRDTRRRSGGGGLSASSAVVITDNTLSTLGGNAGYFGAQIGNVRTNIVLSPGGWLYVAPSSDNVAITYLNLVWRERPLNRSEL